MGSAHCTRTHGTRTRAWRRQQRDRYIAKRNRHRLDCGTTWLKGFGHIQDTNISHLGQLSKSKALSPHKGFLGDSRESWKLLGQRAHKLARAKQLKIPYPYRVWLNEVELEVELEAELQP